MKLTRPAVTVPVLSRRQFGLIAGGGALLLAAGGTYGVVSRSTSNGAGPVATAFGSLSVVRAGRLARLDAQGRPAFRSVAAAATRLLGTSGAGHVTAAGQAATIQRASTDSHGHDADVLPQDGWPQPANLTWGDIVLLEVALRNTRPGPALFAPGQLRLKLVPSGTTVTPQDFNRGPGAIAGGATEHLWISYLAPHDSLDMEVEYSEPELDGTLRLALPPLSASRA
ncbi:hypothetical protein [Arthrobacter sp. ISL-5]|uniref:hypothetical protein n=1 Tax=Arthrobacter sp. ISL-5 TaxID=2819111 RepID=UPI001BE5A53D|nr:hypothetical protein [Arthrobacter sp. ISL-5]MBT2554367.1 hypothetical protein [Arthrobacter sp. ISL-5]